MFNVIAIPLVSLATMLIITKNRRNLVNILIGLTNFLGGVLTTIFALLKEIVFPTNYSLALVFAKLLYVSCNPTTLARDTSILIENGYKIQCVQPIDMFPHTFHIEVITMFSL